MEILFVTHKYPPSTGGMEQHSYYLHQELKKHATVHLIKPNPKQWKVIFYLTVLIRVWFKLKTNRNIDVVYTNDSIMGLICSLIVGDKVKKISTIHGLDITFPNQYFQTKLINRLKSFDQIVCVSEGTRQECIKRGFSPYKVSVVANGVDHSIADIKVDKDYLIELSDQLEIDEDTHIIVSTGRAVRRKGFSWMAQNVLPKLDHRVLYLIVGPTQETTAFQNFLSKFLPKGFINQVKLFFGHADDSDTILELSKQENTRIHHLGKLSFKKMLSVISMADLYIMPNLNIDGDFEGFGLVSLEANLRNKIVVASEIEGITEAIQNGKNGILMPSGDAQAWINRINQLLKSPSLLNELGDEAKTYTTNKFSWSKMSKEYHEIFRAVTMDAPVRKSVITPAIAR